MKFYYLRNCYQQTDGFLNKEKQNRCLLAAGGTESITILTSNNEIWQYMLYDESWKRIPRFIPNNDKALAEEIIKMEQGKGVVALTNLGSLIFSSNPDVSLLCPY